MHRFYEVCCVVIAPELVHSICNCRALHDVIQPQCLTSAGRVTAEFLHSNVERPKKFYSLTQLKNEPLLFASLSLKISPSECHWVLLPKSPLSPLQYLTTAALISIFYFNNESNDVQWKKSCLLINQRICLLLLCFRYGCSDAIAAKKMPQMLPKMQYQESASIRVYAVIRCHWINLSKTGPSYFPEVSRMPVHVGDAFQIHCPNKSDQRSTHCVNVSL